MGGEFDQEILSGDDFPISKNAFPPNGLVLIDDTELEEQLVSLPRLWKEST